jgi:large subunit ribosomal protein L21
MYAVIKTGGKQYKVEQGQTLDVELLGSEVGSDVSFTPVLLVDGESVISTKAALASAIVTAKVLGGAKGPKIVGYMYKSKARAQRRWGHRQKYTTVQVTAITA